MLKPKMTPGQKLDFLHAVCWLCFLAQRSIGLSAFDTFGDKGLMHEAIHAMSNGRPLREDIRTMLAAVERKVPGYWPRTGA